MTSNGLESHESLRLRIGKSTTSVFTKVGEDAIHTNMRLV